MNVVMEPKMSENVRPEMLFGRCGTCGNRGCLKDHDAEQRDELSSEDLEKLSLDQLTERFRSVFGELSAVGRKSLEQAYDVGLVLEAVKQRAPKGKWLSWCENEEIEPRSAQRYLKFRQAVDARDNLSYLPPDTSVRGAMALLAELAASIGGATFSECRTWRYLLWRSWDESRQVLNVVGLNPSTADEQEDDPTIRRCIGYAKAWGYGSLVMTNLFAFRSTYPAGLRTCVDPIGPENDRHLAIAAEAAGLVLVAWGAHGAFRGRGADVLRQLGDMDVRCFGQTKSGQPLHPLYLRADAVPIRLQLAVARG